MSTQIEIKQGGGLKILLVVLTLVMAFSLSLLYREYETISENATKLEGNTLALTEQVESYKVMIDDSTRVNVAKVHLLTLQRDDFKRLYASSAGMIRRLKNHVNDLQSLSAISVISIDTVPGDTVYIDSVKTIHADYKSKWIDISCSIDKNLKDPQFTYSKRDSLMLLKFVEKKRILFGLISWKKEKTATYKAVSFDPNSQITGLSYMEIIK